MTAAYIPYTRHALDADDIKAVTTALAGEWLTQGPGIAEFEAALASRVGARHAIAVSSGTAALHLACLAAGIGPGDEVITTPITFAASANCARYVGAEARFVDVRADTVCMDPALLARAITPRTRAIIPVDFTGQPCDLDEIRKLARDRGLMVIEDAAHALGALYRNRTVGALADMTIFSLHAAKHVAMGEGGAITTDDDTLAEKLRLFRTHGITNDASRMQYPEAAADTETTSAAGGASTPAGWYYEMQALGFNYRITDIQCALGLSQLGKLERSIERRAEIARRYTEAFAATRTIKPPVQLPDRRNAWHLYVVTLDLSRMTRTRRQVFDTLRAAGIGVHVHYIPVHLQPYYRRQYGHRRGDFPVAEKYYDSALTLPLFPSMSDDDCTRVIDAVISAAQ